LPSTSIHRVFPITLAVVQHVENPIRCTITILEVPTADNGRMAVALSQVVRQ